MTLALPKKIDDVSTKLAASEKSVESLKTEIGTLKDEITAFWSSIIKWWQWRSGCQPMSSVTA